MNLKDNIFNVLTEKYDGWYDSEEGKPLYESELICLNAFIEDCSLPVLEIGAGTGRFAKCFSGTIGVDPAFNALRLAQQRGIQVVQTIGEMLPFKDETFGCVLLIVTLCFVQNPVDVLKEAKRVLKRNGSIIIGLVPKDSPWGIFYEAKKKQGHPFYSHARFYSRKDLEKMLQKCGMKISKIRSTLLQKPQENPHVEAHIDGFFKEAGFICIEAKIKCIP
ncbi:MAG: class I SAM-dependent methyltransferase [Nitrospirae bacterium]|jgi:ubiquinone/menaquinone biosynthesis C-methylase UbiE|nr:class I SAM-dependent methyltransferase [Nitrospirota bacterium]